jgi:hypothetical protein
VCPPRSGQGASPGRGDLQPEQGSHGEAARCAQDATQKMPDRQARSKRQPHQEGEGGGGSVGSPLMKIHRRSRRGVATLPARWYIGARCRGRPRRRLPAPQQCRHHGGHRRPRATRMWARARDK